MITVNAGHLDAGAAGAPSAPWCRPWRRWRGTRTLRTPPPCGRCRSSWAAGSCCSSRAPPWHNTVTAAGPHLARSSQLTWGWWAACSCWSCPRRARPAWSRGCAAAASPCGTCPACPPSASWIGRIVITLIHRNIVSLTCAARRRWGRRAAACPRWWGRAPRRRWCTPAAAAGRRWGRPWSRGPAPPPAPGSCPASASARWQVSVQGRYFSPLPAAKLCRLSVVAVTGHWTYLITDSGQGGSPVTGGYKLQQRNNISTSTLQSHHKWIEQFPSL